jgi:Zn-dependent peptidase ImmA (M78 family)/transcriptional regulator with XRE-family HTH domain
LFYRDRLRQARELCGLRQSELAKRVGRSQGTIANIESGISEPSKQLLADVAKSTGFPVAFFSTPTLIQFPTEEMMFRARASMARREAVAGCRYAEIVYELMVSVLESYVEPLHLSLQKSNDSPVLAAQKTRRVMRMPPDQPVTHVIHATEKSGVLVLALPLEFEKIDAFSACVGEEPKRPVIAVCRITTGDRVRWTVTHELAHVVLHSDRTQLRAEDHREADQFAAEFLLPEVAMRQELTAPVTLSSIAALKPKWGVSMQALVRRAFGLSIISERQYKHLFEEISANGWRMREPSNLDIPIEKPRALRQIAEIAYGHPIDYARLAAESQLTVEMVKQIMGGYEEALPEARRMSRSGKVIQLRR